MARSKELPPQMRARICEPHSQAKYGYKKIHKFYPEIPLSTIRYTITQEAKRKDNASQQRSGRPGNLSEDQKQHILDQIKERPTITHQDLLVSIDYAVKERALRGFLYYNNLRKWQHVLFRSSATMHIRAQYNMFSAVCIYPGNTKSSTSLVNSSPATVNVGLFFLEKLCPTFLPWVV